MKFLIFSKKKKIPSFLICKKELINFYKKYGWVKLNKRKYKIEDHKNHLTGMTFDLKNKDREKILKFYYHV